MMKPVGLVASLTALLAATVALSGDRASPFDTKLASDRQALHVLNRLAYGPRPGEVEAVRRMGVKAWIQQQLEPAKLAQSPVLEGRLRLLSAMELPTWQLFESFQPQQMMTGINFATPNLTQLLPTDKL